MISQAEAETLLQPLAQPTLDAFSEARDVHDHVDADELLSEMRERCAGQVRGLVVGIEDWGVIATVTAEQYARVPGVERELGRHPLTHSWTVAGKVRLQLKSDVHAFDYEQLALPGFGGVELAALPTILLTWSGSATRPAFVHKEGSSIVWRMPVEMLLSMPAQTITPDAPTAKLTSKRTPDTQIDDAADSTR